MSLLTIVQDAAMEVGISQPNAAVGNPDVAVQRLLRAAQSVGSDLVATVDWTALRRKHTFTATLGMPQPAAIPADFARMIPGTFWDRTNNRLVSGPLPAMQWQVAIARNVTGWVFTLANGVQVYPGFAGGEQCELEYVTTHFCQSANGTGQARWLLDTDTARLSEELITLGTVAYFLRGVGLPTAPSAMAAYIERRSIEASNDRASVDIMSSGDMFGPMRGIGAVTEFDAFTVGESVLI